MDLATTVRHRILVIRLGALGNIVQSLGSFAAIRAHHPDAEITLLTLKPYAAWMQGTPWFDRVWIDEQPAWLDLPGLRRLRKRLIEGRFERVYDLQTSSRSNRYFKLFPRGSRPEWSGIAPGCSHPDADPDRNRLHDLVRQPNQLRQAGIADVPPADLSWCTDDIARFELPARIVLLVPGCSPRRPGKRWPVEHYAALAAEFVRRGVTPVVIGSGSERDLGRAIHDAVPQAVNLTGKTSLGDVAALARVAVGAVGNDTGPIHLIATAGCRCVAIFSHDSDPALCAPGGADVRVLRREHLATLTPAEVLAAFDA